MYLKLVTAVAFTMILSLFASHAVAATIESLNLVSDKSGQSLNIGLDAPVDYQVFDLEGPSRLILSFPGATLAKGISSIQGEDSVNKISPTQDSNSARLEIGLSQGVKYNITEQGNNLLISFSPQARPQSNTKGAELVDIQVRERGGSTELILRGNHLDANYNTLVTNEGKTMVLDFWGGKSRLPKEHFSYTAKRINAVTLGSEEGRLRLVVSLTSGTDDNHQIVADVNQMIVRFGKSAAKAQAGSLLVEAIDFQPDDRIANLVIRTNDTDPIINLQEKNGNIIIDLKHARLAEGQERSQDVRAFSGPVKQIDSYVINKDVRIVARLRQKAIVSSYQTGNVLTVTLKPKDLVSAQSDEEVIRDEIIYSGQKVTFNYKDIDIRNALKLIAEMSDVNIIMSDDVTGLLTMRLVDVPWDQALDLILTSKGLGKTYAGNVMRIAPLKVLQEDAEARRATQKSIEEVAPLETEFIQLGYASVNDVSTILKGESVSEGSAAQGAAGQSGGGSSSQASGGGIGGEGGLKLLSERGSILLDERSNTMIITDTRERLNNIKRLVAVIDKPMKQVLIEARIVEATDTFSRNLGIKWGGSYNDPGGLNNKFTHQVNGAAAGTNIVDLGVAVVDSGGAIGYSLGTLSGALNLNLELSAAEANSDIKIISSPRLITENNQDAYIKQGTKVPIVTPGTTTEPPTTELEDALLELRVTPQITADNNVILEIFITKDAPVTVGGLTGISTKEIKTKVLLESSETIVLGGIYTREDNIADDGVPGFKDIPILGWLFKKNIKKDNRSELLIFLTPQVIEQALIVGENSG
jgi:type IV pilus assembly protein PilQ